MQDTDLSDQRLWQQMFDTWMIEVMTVVDDQNIFTVGDMINVVLDKLFNFGVFLWTDAKLFGNGVDEFEFLFRNFLAIDTYKNL